MRKSKSKNGPTEVVSCEFESDIRSEDFNSLILKLQLDLPYKDLAYRFDVSTTISKIFYKWLSIMDEKQDSLIIWPDRESLWKTMLMCFRACFGKSVAVIIDCHKIIYRAPL